MGGFTSFKPEIDELLKYEGELSEKIMGYQRIPTWEAQGYTDRFGRPNDPQSRELVQDRKAVTPSFGIGTALAGTSDNYVAGAIASSLGASFVAMGGLGETGLTNLGDGKINYTHLLGVGRRNEVVYRCMRLLQDASIGPKMTVEKFTENPVPEIRQNDILKDRDFAPQKSTKWEPDKTHLVKRLLMKPGKGPHGMTGKRLMALWIADLNTYGKFFGKKVRAGSLRVVEVLRLDPRNVEPYAYEYDKVKVWRYCTYDGDGREVSEEFILSDDMIFHTFLNQRNPLTDGLPPMAVALNAALADIGKTDFVRQFFDNKATPGGILTVENVVLDQARADDIKRRWQERFSRWARGQNSIAVLDQNAKYQPVSSKLDELDSEFTTSQLECRLCMVFGVPPVLAFTYGGINRATYTNSDQSERFFWSNTLIPLFDSILDCLTWQLLTEFESEESILDEEIRLRWDYSDVRPLQEDLDAKHKRARDNVAGGIWTVSEARVETDATVDPYGDYYLRQTKNVPSYPDIAAADAAILGAVPSVQVISTGDGQQAVDGAGTPVGPKHPGPSLDKIAAQVQSANPQADAVRNAVNAAKAGAKESRPQ